MKTISVRNKMEKKYVIKKTKTKKCFLEKSDKIDKPLVRLMKYKEKIRFININNEKCITTDSVGIKQTLTQF